MNAQGHEESRTETVSIKVSRTLKDGLDNLPENVKHKLISKILKEMDFAVYISKYKPPDTL